VNVRAHVPHVDVHFYAAVHNNCAQTDTLTVRDAYTQPATRANKTYKNEAFDSFSDDDDTVIDNRPLLLVAHTKVGTLVYHSSVQSQNVQTSPQSTLDNDSLHDDNTVQRVDALESWVQRLQNEKDGLDSQLHSLIDDHNMSPKRVVLVKDCEAQVRGCKYMV
jgi:hypothetical protein